MPPVIAIAAAVGTVSAGMAAVAAGSSLIGGMMIAGGVMSGLGAITGNKKLSMIGGVLGLAGGIGGMMSGAWDTAASSIAESSMVNAIDPAQTAGDALNSFDKMNVGEAAASAGNGGAETVAGEMAKTAPEAGPNFGTDRITDNANGGVVDSAREAFGAATPEAPNALNDTNAAMTRNAQVTQQQAQPASQSHVEARATWDGDAANRAGSGYGANAPTVEPDGSWQNTRALSDPNTGVVAGRAEQGGSLWDRVKQVPRWIEENKETAKLAGGLVSGAMKSYGDQSLLKQRYALEDEQRQRERQRYSDSVRGLHMPVYRRNNA